MATSNDVLGQLMQAENIEALSKAAGVSPQKAAGLLNNAIPLLVAGMAQNAETAAGAKSLNKALDDHAADDADDLARQLGGNDLTDGAKILRNILGDEAGTVKKSLAKSSGLSSNQTILLLAALAPTLLSLLGKKKQEDNVPASGLGSLLGALLGTSSSSGSLGGALLGSLLGGSSSASNSAGSGLGGALLGSLLTGGASSSAGSGSLLTSLAGSLLTGAEEEEEEEEEDVFTTLLTGGSSNNAGSGLGGALLGSLLGGSSSASNSAGSGLGGALLGSLLGGSSASSDGAGAGLGSLLSIFGDDTQKSTPKKKTAAKSKAKKPAAKKTTAKKSTKKKKK